MSNSQTLSVNLTLPVGTQVVAGIEIRRPTGEPLCLRRVVGVVVKARTDNHTYQVRLPDGTKVYLRRHEFSIRKHHLPEVHKATAPLNELLVRLRMV